MGLVVEKQKNNRKRSLNQRLPVHVKIPVPSLKLMWSNDQERSLLLRDRRGIQTKNIFPPFFFGISQTLIKRLEKVLETVLVRHFTHHQQIALTQSLRRKSPSFLE